MPFDEEIQSRPETERIDFFRFLSDYGASVFEAMHRRKQESGVSFKLAHTFDIRSFGGYSANRGLRDAFAWVPYCDLLDWDVYMYPLWRGTTKMIFNLAHYQFAGYRTLGWYYGKPTGYWVELDDGTIPRR